MQPQLSTQQAGVCVCVCVRVCVCAWELTYWLPVACGQRVQQNLPIVLP